MNTPKDVKRVLDISTDMTRYYVKNYFLSIGKNIDYSMGMELNGSYRNVMNFILSKSKDEGVRKRAKAQLDESNGESITNQLTNKPERMNQDSTNELAEQLRVANERIERMEQNEQDQIAIREKENEAFNQVSLMKQESEQMRAELEKDVERLTGTVDELREIVSANEKKSKAWVRDIGNYVLSSPNVKFACVMILVAAQAYLFALLEESVLASVQIEIELWAAFTVGILFEASGFMIARQFPPANKYESFSTRDWWLVIFFVFQCVTNVCLFEPFNADSLPIGIGRGMISLATPVGLLAYSFLYFKKQTNEVK